MNAADIRGTMVTLWLTVMVWMAAQTVLLWAILLEVKGRKPRVHRPVRPAIYEDLYDDSWFGPDRMILGVIWVMAIGFTAFYRLSSMYRQPEFTLVPVSIIVVACLATFEFKRRRTRRVR